MFFEHQLQKAGIQIIAERASRRSEVEGILDEQLKFNNPEPVNIEKLRINKVTDVLIIF